MKTILVAFFFGCLLNCNSVAAANNDNQKTIASPDTSAPDAWGYTYERSTDPGGPVFHWVDISLSGIPVAGLVDDNQVGPFGMGFEFPYYWYGFSEFQIGSNGYIMSAGQLGVFAYPFGPFPSSTTPNDIIGAMVGDLVFSGAAGASGQCFYWSNGFDSLVVSFINVTEWETTINPAATHTFQIILCKSDSSVTFQYGSQGGSFNSNSNRILTIGIENQSGSIGLTYGYSTVPPHSFMPTDGLALRIKRTVNTGLSVTDAGMIGGFNNENIGRVIEANTPTQISAVIKNYGTTVLTDVVVYHSIKRGADIEFQDSSSISSIQPGEVTEVLFPDLYAGADPGFRSVTFSIEVAGDEGPSNNVMVSEINVVSLAEDQRTELSTEDGVFGGSAYFQGGGMGIRLETPAGPVRLDTIMVHVNGLPDLDDHGMTVEVREDSLGFPGSVITSKSTLASNGWNPVSFVSDNIHLQAGSFFVTVMGEIDFSYETMIPVSCRSWENTGSWVPFRSRYYGDVMIRAVVHLDLVDIPEIGHPVSPALFQNYPNPFNPSTTIAYTISNHSHVRLTVFNILGQQVQMLVDEDKAAGMQSVVWNGRDDKGRRVSSGVYLCRLESDFRTETLKMIVLK